MGKTDYNITFSNGGLLYRESLTIAEQYENLGDWEAVKEKVLDNNLLQIRTLSGARRIFGEARMRIRTLTDTEMELLLVGSHREQSYLLWLAACKRSRFIHDFAVEVIREKYLRLDLDLLYEDYDAFFNAKAEWHPELDRVALTTYKQQRLYLFQMLREAELLTKENRIIPAMLPPGLVEAIQHDSPAFFAIFPVSDADVKEWVLA